MKIPLHSEKLYSCLFALLIIVLPFSKALPNIIIPLLTILFIIDFKKVNFRPLYKGPALLLYLFLFYFFIKGAVTQSLFTEWNVYKKFIILLIVPVLFLNVRYVYIVKVAAVISVNATILASLYLAGAYYAEFGALPFKVGEDVNKVLILERPYAGFFAVLGTILSFSLVRQYPRYRALLIVSGILSVLFITIIAARISFMSLVAVAAVYILFYAKISTARKSIAVAASMLAVVLIFLLNENIAHRFFLKQSLEVASDYEPRLVIWPCAYEMAMDDALTTVFGYPDNATVEANYLGCYERTIKNESKKGYYLSTKFNSHNQFIDFFLTQGVVGLALFAGFFWGLLYYVKNNFFYVAITLSFIFFLAVENVLHRQMGCYIFSIFAAILLTRNKLIDDKD